MDESLKKNVVCLKLDNFLFNPFPNTPFWDHPKFKDAADDNWNVAVNPLPDDKILDWSKWKQIADNMLKCI